jgi:hypothetical protein
MLLSLNVVQIISEKSKRKKNQNLLMGGKVINA